VNNFPENFTRQHGGRGSNLRPLSHQSDASATRLSSHPNHNYKLTKQEAFEKCWAHSPLRAAARAIHQVSLVMPPAHRCPRRCQRRRQRQRQQRQRVTEGTAMAPWNGPIRTHITLKRR